VTRAFAFLFAILIYSSSALSVFPQGGWQQHKAQTRGDLISVYFTSAEKGWIAGDGGYLAWTNDGGNTWVKHSLNTTENINEIYFRNDDNGYLVAGRKMFITRDGGNTWRETGIFNQADFKGGTPEFLSIRFADKKRGLVVGSVLNRKGDVVDSLVMRTEDGGETWHRLIVPSKTELFHLDYNGNSHGWIVGDQGVVLATTDGGANWASQNSGTKNALFNVDFRDDEEGYAVGEKGTILRTENGGANWEKVSTANLVSLMRVDFADDKNGWIVGHGGTVLRSSDKGRTWARQDSNTTNHLYGLFFSKKRGWAVGAKGLIIDYQK
jgi:photosystem II stability/assembly factor-like uncharacterized protein